MKNFIANLNPKTLRIVKIVAVIAGVLLVPGIVISFVLSMWAILTTGFSGLPFGTVFLLIAGLGVLYWKRRQIVRFITRKVNEYNRT